MADNKFQVEVEVTGDGEIKFRKLTESVEEFGKKGSSALERITGAFDVFTGTIAADAVKGAFNFLISAGEKLFEETFGKGIEAAIETEDAINGLNQALVATGKFSQETSQGLVAFAGELQKTTKFGDDAIIQTEALLASLTKLDGEGLKKATKAALDLSAGLNQDLNTSTLQVAKAIEGSAGKLGVFGLRVDETRSKADNFAKTLEFVNSKFGGAAESQVNTYSGALTVLANTVQDAQKEFGFAVIQNQSLVNVIKAASGIVGEFQEAIAKNRDGIRDFISQGVVLAVQGIGLMATAVEKAYIGFLRLEQGFVAVQQQFAIFKVFTEGTRGVGQAVTDTQKKFSDLGEEIARIKRGESAFTTIQNAVTKLKDAAVAGFGQTADTSNLATRSLQAQKTAVEELTQAQIKLAEEGKRLSAEAQKKDPAAEFEGRFEALQAAFEQELISYQERNEAIAVFRKEAADKDSELLRKQAEDVVALNASTLGNDVFTMQEKRRVMSEGLQAILQSERLNAADRAKVQRDLTTIQNQQEQDRLNAATGALGALASLQNSKFKEFGGIAKAAAIAQATIDTYRGASAAAAAMAGIPFAGPFLAAAAAGAFITAGLARVAQIASTPLATGIDEVPAGYPNDTFPARLTSGEGVIDAGTNKELKAWLASSGAMVPLLQGIYSTLQQMKLQVVVNIGTRTLVNELFDAADSGRTISL